jgi:hypothetical protein
MSKWTQVELGKGFTWYTIHDQLHLSRMMSNFGAESVLYSRYWGLLRETKMRHLAVNDANRMLKRTFREKRAKTP